MAILILAIPSLTLCTVQLESLNPFPISQRSHSVRTVRLAESIAFPRPFWSHYDRTHQDTGSILSVLEIASFRVVATYTIHLRDRLSLVLPPSPLLFSTLGPLGFRPHGVVPSCPLWMTEDFSSRFPVFRDFCRVFAFAITADC